MRRSGLVLVCLLSCAAAGCGDDEDGGDDQAPLVVSAAASLEPAFVDYVDAAGIDARQSFAGSDDLAAQIRQGITPDVYAAANTALPEALYEEGLVEEPVVFATNELVLAVPAGSQVSSLDDVAQPGVSLAIGDEGVPVGDYARDALAGLPTETTSAILDNVRSNEPDVSGIVGKLTQGAVDAGFVYASDVVAASGDLEAIALPARLEPTVAYAAAVVDGADEPDAARTFIDGLLQGEGARALRDAGFGPPP